MFDITEFDVEYLVLWFFEVLVVSDFDSILECDIFSFTFVLDVILFVTFLIDIWSSFSCVYIVLLSPLLVSFFCSLFPVLCAELSWSIFSSLLSLLFCVKDSKTIFGSLEQ